MKVLITGGAGFIGSHLAEHFQNRADVRILDNFRSGHRQNLKGLSFELIEGSILDRELVRRTMKGVDYVFHLAAMVSVPESMQKPTECVQTNTVGTLIVLEEAADAGVKKLVFSSSAAIYGDNPIVPKTEEMEPEPKSPYGITKLDGELYCRMFEAEKKCATVSLRYFNVFGPRQNPKSQYAAAVPIFIDRALKGEPITVFGDGEQTRDFVYVKDIVAANAFFAMQSPAIGTFNVGYGQRLTVNRLVEQIVKLTGSRSKVEYLPERAGDVKHSFASTTRLQEVGFLATSSFEEGLADTIRSFSPE